MSRCPLCTYENENLVALSVHWRKLHKSTAERLRILLFHGGERPTCACGCGGAVKFHSIKVGFSDFVLGHHSRLKNNWGHNKEAQEKSQETRRGMHSRGEITIWNRGKTKETSRRVAEVAQTQSDNFTTERRQERSRVMKRSWREGKIKPLKGPDHSQWKGGVSSLQQLCRANLFRAWSRPIMERDRFTCQRCGQQHDLCVHHDGQRFADILQLAMQHFGYDDARELTFAQKDELSEWIIGYHAEHGITGITLCEGCHAGQHAA